MQIYAHNTISGLNARFYRLATAWYWYDEDSPYDYSHVSADAVAAGIAACTDPPEAPLLVDIEAFDLDGTQEDHDFAVTQLALACSMWKAAYPKKPIGIYRLFPERNYSDPANLAYYSYSAPGGAHAAADLVAVNAWKVLTDRSIASLYSYIDFICPSVYVIYGDAVQDFLLWQYFASANIAEAVRIARQYNKQCWPIICDADVGATGDPVSDDHWTFVVNNVAACAGVDGIMLYILDTDHPDNYVSALNTAAAVHHKSWPFTLSTYRPAVITAGGLYLSIDRDTDTSITASAPRLLFKGTAGLGVAQGAAVASWTSQDTLSYAAVQATAGNKPTYDAASMASGGGVVFDGVDDYLRITTCPLTSTTAGTVVVCFRTGATAWLTMGDQVLVSAADEAATNKWFEVGIDIAGYPYVESNASGTKHTVRCSTQLSNEMDYCLSILWNDTAYTFLVNDVVQQQVVRNTGTAAWFGDVAGVDGFVIGGTLTSAGIQRCFEGKIATVAGYNSWSTIVKEAEV